MITAGDLVIVCGPSAIGDGDHHRGRVGRVVQVVPPGEHHRFPEPYARVEFVPGAYRGGTEWSGYALSNLAPADPDDPGVLQWLLWLLEA